MDYASIIRQHGLVRGGRTINEAEAEVVRRMFREFSAKISPRAIARRLNDGGIPGPSGKLWTDSTPRGHAKRSTGRINNERYIGRLVWNRLRYFKALETGRHGNPTLSPPCFSRACRLCDRPRESGAFK